MASRELNELLTNWLAGRERQFTLFENNDEIDLRRDEQHLLLSVQLTHQHLNKAPLEIWMRLAQSSLKHFQGALAAAPANGHLWLLQRLSGKCTQDHLLASLEALLNQRDTWRATIERLARPGLKLNPTSLRAQLQ